MQIHQYLELDVESNTVSCMECGEELCAGEQNYKEYVAQNRTSIEELGPEFSPPEDVLGYDPGLELRRYYCPGCGILLDHQVAMEDDPIIHDIDIDVASLQ